MHNLDLTADVIRLVHGLAKDDCVCDMLNAYENWGSGRVEIPRCDPCDARRMIEHARVKGKFAVLMEE